jgi:hypothetical protein
MPYLCTIGQHLANVLKTHGAWVTECLSESRRLRAFAFWMDGRCAEAIHPAQDLMTTVPVEVARRVPELEFVLTTPVLSFVRCGQWDDVVRHPAPPADLTYSMALWHYARGLAFVALGELTAKRKQTEEALENLNEAVRLQDELRYYEPPDWYYPIRESLGTLLLATGMRLRRNRYFERT